MRNLRAITNRLRRGDRGASGVEYALVVSLLLTGSTATFEMMDDRVSEHYTDTADDIGVADLSHFDVTTTTCGSCETTTTTTLAATTTTVPVTVTIPVTTTLPVITTTTPPTTTAAPTTTTTTAAPTTTTTTTTTTVAPTTTLPPTTTVPSAPAAEAEFKNLSYEAWNGWKAKTRITLLDDDGKKLKNASFEVTWVTADGEVRTRTFETNKNGVKTPTWGKRDRNDFPIVMTVNWVEEDGETYTPIPAVYVIDR